MKAQVLEFSRNRQAGCEANEALDMTRNERCDVVAKMHANTRSPIYMQIYCNGPDRKRFDPVSELGPVLDRKWRQHSYE